MVLARDEIQDLITQDRLKIGNFDPRFLSRRPTTCAWETMPLSCQATRPRKDSPRIR